MEREFVDLASLIPAGGWRIERTYNDGSTWSGPLVGWGLQTNGIVVPLSTDGDGYVDEPVGKFRIYHPEEVFTEKPSEQTTTKETD